MTLEQLDTSYIYDDLRATNMFFMLLPRSPTTRVALQAETCHLASSRMRLLLRQRMPAASECRLSRSLISGRRLVLGANEGIHGNWCPELKIGDWLRVDGRLFVLFLC